MNESDNLKSIRLLFHYDSLLDPVYEEGYLAPSEYHYPYPANPYPFPENIAVERARVAGKDSPLNKKEKAKLASLNKKFAATKWDRWGKGNYYRWCVEGS